MEMKVIMKLNERQTVETKFDGADLGDTVLKAGPFLDFDGECAFCKSQNIRLQTRVAGDAGQYKYTEFVCNDCGAKRQMGKHKDGNSYFLKQWEEKYVKPDGE